MQTAIVMIVLAIAVGYAGWRLRKALTAASDPCADCPGCALKEEKRRKEACERKKHVEKFGQKEKKH